MVSEDLVGIKNESDSFAWQFFSDVSDEQLAEISIELV